MTSTHLMSSPKEGPLRGGEPQRGAATVLWIGGDHPACRPADRENRYRNPTKAPLTAGAFYYSRNNNFLKINQIMSQLDINGNLADSSQVPLYACVSRPAWP